MYSSKESDFSIAKLLLSWPALTVKIIFFALLSIWLTKPCGSIAGKIAFEQKNFQLYATGLEDRKVSAVAIGPREGVSDERGV